MSLFNFGGTGEGLLGLGGFGAGNPGMEGLLGEMYDPAAAKRFKIKQGLLNAGMAILDRKPGENGFGRILARGIMGGAQGAMSAEQQYADALMQGMKMKDYREDRDWEKQERERKMNVFKALDAEIDMLPREQRAWARANPEAFAKMKLEQAFPKPGDGPEYGLNPVWLQNPQTGEYMLVQPSKDGSAPRQMQFPDGYVPAPPNRSLDTGTGFVTQPTRGVGAPVGGVVPKNVAEMEAQQEIGTAQGKAIASAPADMAAAETALGLLEQIKQSPYLSRGTGASSVLNVVPGTGGYGFQKMVDQATSGAFLTAIQQMRGLGALSNAEGQTATQAVTRMNTAASEEDFLKALADYEAIVRMAYGRAAARIGAPGMEQGGAPQGNSDLKAKYGLE